MCAIFGAVGVEDDDLIAAMGRVLSPRGPDGGGVFRGSGVAIGNRRLSVIDIAGGGQPIYSEDRNLVISHSGEIYNYLELREELEAKGHRFRTETDTEVIVHAFEEWGDAALDRFNGMFAFALYDRHKRELLLARDPSGQKPLYYWQGGGRLVFASEIKAILCADFVERRANHAALDPYLALRYVPEPQTLFEGIHTVPAGHWLRHRPSGSELQRYWSVPLTTHGDKPKLSPRDWEERLATTLDGAVARHLRADVPCGAYLSAGVDSALMVALMNRHSPAPVQTYAIGFGSEIDETEGAAETARLLGTEHHEVQLGAADFAALPRVISQMDRPVGDALILAFDKLAAAAAGERKVMLGGEGADELFAGFPFHKILGLAELYRKIVPDPVSRHLVEPAVHATPHRLLGKFFNFPAALGEGGKRKLLDFLRGSRSRGLAHNAAALRTLWGGEERALLYSDDFVGMARERWLRDAPERGEFLDRMLATQWDEWLQDWALIRQEKNNMAHGVEFRAPFLDRELIELAFRMPASMKLRGLRDKWILRQVAARHLPKAVARRKKIPFYLPVGQFLRTKEMRHWIDLTLNREQVTRRGYFRPSAVESLRARVDQSPGEFVAAKQLVSLVVLELWHMAFIDSGTAPIVSAKSDLQLTTPTQT